MSCPDELLDRDDLTSEERQTLAAHARTCSACALELRMPLTLQQSSVSRERVRRVVDGALRAPRKRRPVKMYALLAAAILLVTASAAAAIGRFTPPPPPPPKQEIAVVTTAAPPAPPHIVAVSHAGPVEDTVQTETPVVVKQKPKPSAADLFARANRTRQSGDTKGAIALYRELEREHPTSNEAAVADISLARALLEDSPKEALASVDQYLARPTQAELREEALALRARACAKLGNRDEEKKSWQTLLTDYPDSLHAPRAKQRLDDLR